MGDIGIIGCGPAGLLAAHAAVQAGYEPTLFAPGATPSPPAPGVFLHMAIPELADPARPDDNVTFRKLGRESVYARKVYGCVTATSWRKFTNGSYPAWALDPLYRQLWQLYGDLVQPGIVKGDDIKDFLESYRLTINTAPLERLCIGGHGFPRRRTWYVADAPNWVRHNEMVYNGLEENTWFRASKFFGRKLTEFAVEPSNGSGAQGMKVQPTDCDCHPGMLRVGRWGTWQPGVLLHHAYLEARHALHEL
jgi:hypothetical protein